jgi:hypothetical protein
LTVACSTIRAYLLRQRLKAIGLATATAVALGNPVVGQTVHSNYDDPSTAEGYAWSQIKLGLPADFNSRCGRLLDPTREGDSGWRGAPECRTLPADFLSDIFSKSSMHDAVTYKGIELRGAKFVRNVDLTFAKIDRPIQIYFSDFDNSISLADARAESEIVIADSTVNGLVSAPAFRSQSSLTLSGSTLKGGLNLSEANIERSINLIGVTGTGLNGYFLQTGRLFMESEPGQKTSFKFVNFDFAKINEVGLTGTSVDGLLSGQGMQVEGGVLMQSDHGYKSTFRSIDLHGANIAGPLDFDGAALDGDLDAHGTRVGGGLFMRTNNQNEASFGRVNLNGATVTGGLSMDGAVFRGELIARGLRVTGDLSLRNTYTDSLVSLPFLQVGGNLELGGANLTSLDLTGATVAGELRLGKDNKTTVGWTGKNSYIDFRSARVSSMASNKYSWPAKLFLDGFTFARFGAFDGDVGKEKVERRAAWWLSNFAERDDYNSAPYEQLAAAFVATGDHDAADEIHYKERIRADEQDRGWGGFVWSQFLRWAAGYGIGSYMFRALYWALGLSVLGAVLLRFWATKGVFAESHGFLWCLGASVNRLLPGVNLKKEFSDFFDDRKINQFTPAQDFFFVILAALGWVLGAIVIAAFATITHGS